MTSPGLNSAYLLVTLPGFLSDGIFNVCLRTNVVTSIDNISFNSLSGKLSVYLMTSAGHNGVAVK